MILGVFLLPKPTHQLILRLRLSDGSDSIKNHHGCPKKSPVHMES